MQPMRRTTCARTVGFGSTGTRCRRGVFSELESLDPLRKQMIQRAKAFQAVYRLGTYTGKMPSHTSVKAGKGTMLFLP